MLNREQKKAVFFGKGQLLVLAGPGSGKTTVITERIKHIIENEKAAPEEILVLTFSRAAADEMKERFIKSQRLTSENCRITFGTFHSVFYHVLKTYYGYKAESYIFEENPETGNIIEIRFDEMLMLTLELLREREDIRNNLRNKYKWILIDEFQDIDEIQYEIIKLIADRNSNLSVVGDDDQSIYEFRGARPDIILNFRRDYPKAEKVVLKLNYRSGEEIVRVSQKLIGHNIKRYRKHLRSAAESKGEVCIRNYYDAKAEYEDIARQIEKGSAVLYRTNIQGEYFKIALSEYGKCPDDYPQMTFHESKGLEFDTVYIIDAAEGITPHGRRKDRKKTEEERRMFYVAMTRAKRRLIICYADFIQLRKYEKSRFIKEIERKDWFKR